MERQITLGESDIITQVRQLGEQVILDPNHFSEKALQLQKLLNTISLHLKQDGLAGNRTSEAYRQVSGKFLNGDSRRI
jgi:hypothetical protein